MPESAPHHGPGERPPRRGAHVEAIGTESPAHAADLHLFGVVLDRRGDHAQAQARMREALELRRRLLGPEHREVAETLLTLADSLMAEERLVEAAELYGQALEILRGCFGESHGRVARIQQGLARLLLEAGRAAEAGALFSRELEARRAELPASHPDIAETLRFLARVRISERDFGAALAAARECLAIELEHVAETDERVLSSRLLVGRCLHALGQMEEAEEEMLRCHDAAAEAHSQGMLHSASQSLVELYEDWDRPELAAEFRTLFQQADENR